MPIDAGERWRRRLSAWAIPAEILRQATDDPWACPVEAFAVDEHAPVTLSHRLAREALDRPGVVLDIGAGGGAMSAPLRDVATRVVAVDQSQAMLDSCSADVRILGRWPDVAGQVPVADVVVSGHVLYNVPDLENFLTAANAVARRRVILEITERHPRADEWERSLWRRFWNIERPTTPTSEDVVAVAAGVGITPKVQRWETRAHGYPRLEELLAAARRRLCLGPEREGEVREALSGAVQLEGRWYYSARPRSLVTLWWDLPAAVTHPS